MQEREEQQRERESSRVRRAGDGQEEEAEEEGEGREVSHAAATCSTTGLGPWPARHEDPALPSGERELNPIARGPF